STRRSRRWRKAVIPRSTAATTSHKPTAASFHEKAGADSIRAIRISPSSATASGAEDETGCAGSTWRGIEPASPTKRHEKTMVHAAARTEGGSSGRARRRTIHARATATHPWRAAKARRSKISSALIGLLHDAAQGRNLVGGQILGVGQKGDDRRQAPAQRLAHKFLHQAPQHTGAPGGDGVEIDALFELPCNAALRAQGLHGGRDGGPGVSPRPADLPRRSYHRDRPTIRYEPKHLQFQLPETLALLHGCDYSR